MKYRIEIAVADPAVAENLLQQLRSGGFGEPSITLHEIRKLQAMGMNKKEIVLAIAIGMASNLTSDAVKLAIETAFATKPELRQVCETAPPNIIIVRHVEALDEQI